MNGPGKSAGHAGGLVPFGHEVGSHVWDIFDGKSNAEIGKTDEEKPNGLSIAEEIGLAMAAEAPDLSREEAEKLLEELLQLGQELEKALVVKVTSESNPRTGR